VGFGKGCCRNAADPRSARQGARTHLRGGNGRGGDECTEHLAEQLIAGWQVVRCLYGAMARDSSACLSARRTQAPKKTHPSTRTAQASRMSASNLSAFYEYPSQLGSRSDRVAAYAPSESAHFARSSGLVDPSPALTSRHAFPSILLLPASVQWAAALARSATPSRPSLRAASLALWKRASATRPSESHSPSPFTEPRAVRRFHARRATVGAMRQLHGIRLLRSGAEAKSDAGSAR
jgi:hypothetical protein